MVAMPMSFPLFAAHEIDFGRLLIQRAAGGRLLLPVAPCLLRMTERVVLVDAGFDPGLAQRLAGVDWQPPSFALDRQLEVLGLTRDDVSDVILTHLHDDHAGGVFDRERGAPVFPNARLHLQELALWRGLDRVARGGERFISAELLEWLGDWPLAVRHHGDWELGGEIQVRHTGGHTPGHQVVLAGEGRLRRGGEGDLAWERTGDGGGDLLLGGDLLSLKAAFNPAFRTSSDLEPEVARTRRRELATAADSGLACYLYHGVVGKRFRRPDPNEGRGRSSAD